MRAQPSPMSQFDPNSGYELHDDQDPDALDSGDLPLLRRDNTMSSMPIPGDYELVSSDDRSESNIRYGRIPQRVPRRYKTIKKVE